MALMSKSMFTGDEELLARFEKTMETSPDSIKKLKDSMIPVAELIKEMTETRGWKEIIRPFLEKKGNPTRLFALIRNKSKDLDYQASKAECYCEFLKMVDVLLKMLD